MNENNDQKQPELKIVSLNISSNKDKDDTYSVEIQTSAHTVVYPKVKVVFGMNQAIAFPVRFQIVDDDNNTLFDYSLNLDKPNQELQTE